MPPKKKSTKAKTRVKEVKKKRRRRNSYKTYEKGGRVEAYTMGEAAGSKKWP